MKKGKVVYAGIIAVAIIAVMVIGAVLIHNRKQQDIKRTDYAIVVSYEDGLKEDTDLKLFIKKSGKGEPCNLRIVTMYEDGPYIRTVSFDGETFSGKEGNKTVWSGFPYILEKRGKEYGRDTRILVFSKKEEATFAEAMMSTGLSSESQTYEQMQGIFL